MSESVMIQSNHLMTEQEIEDFLCSMKESGAKPNLLRRLKTSVQSLYVFLPEDKMLNKIVLQLWRSDMETKGYASATIQNYVKYINKYLDFCNCSAIRFNKGRAKDITEMRFGYLTAKYPTEKRDRKDVVWVCECKCGKMVEYPATRLLLGNTKSCGCIQVELLQRSNKYIDNTSIRQSLDDTVISTRSTSGYIGVIKKRNKWQAQITYKRKKHFLGCYDDINDAIKARARAKELVIADAKGLLNFYDEIHKAQEPIPSRASIEKIDSETPQWKANNTVMSAARRCDNTSGQTGVYKKRNRWIARISHKGVLYKLGSFENIEEAISERKKAEELLKKDQAAFLETYRKN